MVGWLALGKVYYPLSTTFHLLSTYCPPLSTPLSICYPPRIPRSSFSMEPAHKKPKQANRNRCVAGAQRCNKKEGTNAGRLWASQGISCRQCGKYAHTECADGLAKHEETCPSRPQPIVPPGPHEQQPEEPLHLVAPQQHEAKPVERPGEYCWALHL